MREMSVFLPKYRGISKDLTARSTWQIGSRRILQLKGRSRLHRSAWQSKWIVGGFGAKIIFVELIAKDLILAGRGLIQGISGVLPNRLGLAAGIWPSAQS